MSNPSARSETDWSSALCDIVNADQTICRPATASAHCTGQCPHNGVRIDYTPSARASSKRVTWLQPFKVQQLAGGLG